MIIRFLLAFPGTDRLSPIPFLLLMAAMLLIAFPLKDLQRNSSKAVVCLATAVFISLTASFYEFIVDDVFISLRYARNLAGGYGLVFNTDGSTPVEGYTNFLWVVIEAWFFVLTLPDAAILHAIRLAGVLFGAGVIVMTYKLTRIISGDERNAAIAATFLAAVPEFSFWAVGGLETSMYMFWMMAGLYRYLVEKRKNHPHIISIIFFLLMALTRPEGFFFTVALIAIDSTIAIFNWQHQREKAFESLKHIVIGASVFVLLYGVYFLWRYNYYGLPFPNTFYAKKVSSTGYIVHRIKQVSNFFVPLFPFFAFAVLGYLHLSRSVIRERLLAAGLLFVLILFSFAARNEWMPGYRYEVPFLPLLMVFFAIGIGSTFFGPEHLPAREWKTRFSRLTVLTFLGLFLISESRELQKTGNKFSTRLERAHVPLGKWLKKYAPENSTYASWDMGAVPYFSSISHIVDINLEGLLNPYTTSKGYDIDRFLEENPCFLVLPPNTDYVRPAVIREFYTREKLSSEYDYLFSFAFDRDYLLNVYKNKRVNLSDSAIAEGRILAQQSLLHAQLSP